jgi:polyhydroxyalkanoate synthase
VIELVPDEIVEAVTVDGWTLPLRHYAAEGPPVLLVHGLGTDHHNFDLAETVGLADGLRDAGFDVWVASLRGDPDTTPPDGRRRRGWTFDDHVVGDVPALIQTVRDATDGARLLWVGHSMGGMLLYACLGRHGEDLLGGVAVGSAVDFDTPGFLWSWNGAFGWMLAGNGRLPLGPLGGLVGSIAPRGPLTNLLASRDGLDPDEIGALSRHALVDVSKPLLRQARAWIEAGELLDARGTPWVIGGDRPLLVLGGVSDRVVPEPDVAAACAHFSRCTYERLSIEDGWSVDYGHVDPLVGAVAREEVWPRIAAFLWTVATPGASGATGPAGCSSPSACPS